LLLRVEYILIKAGHIFWCPFSLRLVHFKLTRNVLKQRRQWCLYATLLQHPTRLRHVETNYGRPEAAWFGGRRDGGRRWWVGFTSDATRKYVTSGTLYLILSMLVCTLNIDVTLDARIDYRMVQVLITKCATIGCPFSVKRESTKIISCPVLHK
jgi:hypothetical protein